MLLFSFYLLACESRWLSYESRPISDIANPDTVLLANTPPMPEEPEEIGFVTMQQDSVKGILLTCDEKVLVVIPSIVPAPGNNVIAAYFPFGSIKQINRLTPRTPSPYIYLPAIIVTAGTFASLYHGEGKEAAAFMIGFASLAAGSITYIFTQGIAKTFEAPRTYIINGDKAEYLHAQKYLKEFAVSGETLPPEVHRKVYGLENK